MSKVDHWRTYYEGSARLCRECPLVDGVRDGICRMWFDDEQHRIQGVSLYKEDKPNGTAITYFNDDAHRVLSKGAFAAGVPVGVHTTRANNEANRVIVETTFADGQPARITNYFDDEAGRVSATQALRGGKLDGVQRSYFNDEDGRVSEEVTYRDDRMWGRKVTFFNDACHRVASEVHFEDGAVHGLVTAYANSAEHRVLRAVPYVAGRRHGEMRCYYEGSGNLQLVLPFVDGAEHGVATFYYDGPEQRAAMRIPIARGRLHGAVHRLRDAPGDALCEQVLFRSGMQLTFPRAFAAAGGEDGRWGVTDDPRSFPIDAGDAEDARMPRTRDWLEGLRALPPEEGGPELWELLADVVGGLYDEAWGAGEDRPLPLRRGAARGDVEAWFQRREAQLPGGQPAGAAGGARGAGGKRRRGRRKRGGKR